MDNALIKIPILLSRERGKKNETKKQWLYYKAEMAGSSEDPGQHEYIE